MASMDPKILAAVFASIAALAVGTGGGSIDNLQQFSDGDILNGISVPSSDILEKLREKPEPTNRVTVEVSFNSEESILKLEDAGLNISEFDVLASEKRSLQSDGSVLFKDFSGNLKLRRSNATEINGESNGFVSGGVNLTQKNFNTVFSTDASSIVVEDVRRNRINLQEVDVGVDSETGAEISQSDSVLKINSFTGQITVLPAESRLTLEGEVDTLEAGGTVFKGDN